MCNVGFYVSDSLVSVVWLCPSRPSRACDRAFVRVILICRVRHWLLGTMPPVFNGRRLVAPALSDIQGTGAVIAAGFLNAALASGVPLVDQTIVFVGGGSATIGVAEQLGRCMVAKGLTEAAARDRFYVVDHLGLVTATRTDVEPHKLPYVRRGLGKEFPSLLEVVTHVKPTALVGLTGCASVFTEVSAPAVPQRRDVLGIPEGGGGGQ